MSEKELPQLHMRGVELVVELLDAADHVDRMRAEDLRALLSESARVLSELLARDVPPRPEAQD